LAILLAILACLASTAWAASVGPNGYTNDFSVWPTAADFSTSGGIAGGSGDIASADALDAYVQNVAAGTITSQVFNSSPTNPPAKLAPAQWTSAGSGYLLTRPTGNRASLLLATLVNNTGTNCNVLHFNYQLTVGDSFSEEVPGQRLYYSFSTASNTWTTLPSVSGLNASQLVSAEVSLNQTWNNGSHLYLLWVDDNAADGTESAYEIDNFFAAAYFGTIPLTIALTSPANGQRIGSGSALPASVALSGSPTNVSYYVDGVLELARTAVPFSPVNLPAPTLGSHSIYATAEDASGTFLTTLTNTFVVESSLSGTLTVDTTLYAANSPYLVSGDLTVANGVTLSIEPGTTVQLGSGVSLIVASGGRILGPGTSNALIHFTHSGAGLYWGNLTINGVLGSPETRLAYATFDFNANNTGTPCIEVNVGSAFLDHLTFGQPGAPYIHVDGASFTISDCFFPTPTAQFEPCHGTQGVRSDGHGLFLRNFFGKPTGYNDVVDFTGGNRPHPIVQFIGNVVMGGDDDGFDIDGTDAWVEGNIFLHLHRNNGTPDSSSAVSGGNYSYSAGDPGGTGTETSEITIIRNLVYDCDQAADAKQGNFFSFLNNTIVHQTHVGGIDPVGAVVILADTGTTEGVGMYLEGNVIYDVENLTRNVTTALVTYTNNTISQLQGAPWTGPGGNNSTADPLLQHVPQLAETYFTNWASAQVMWDWFRLQPGSPAIGTGPNGRDRGGVVPAGASVSGVPNGTTSRTDATLVVGINRTGSGMSPVGWPNGCGYIAYKWRLDSGVWSPEIPIGTRITLTSLADGAHHVEVIGKTDAGYYQNDPMLGGDATITVSPTWHVQSAFQVTPGALLGTNFSFQFSGAAGNSYSVLYRDAFDGAHPWAKLFDVSAPASSGPILLVDTNAASSMRFYRVVTPAQ
jgi:hypothetical protein